MTTHKGDQTLVLRENGEWLRYVLWGVLLFGFSGFVLQSRRIAIDPFRREAIMTSKGFRNTKTERLKFDEIRKILVLTTFDSVENPRGLTLVYRPCA